MALAIPASHEGVLQRPESWRMRDIVTAQRSNESEKGSLGVMKP